ncbi:hypothetical protein BH23CHL5_BH23CHL5_13960 [soil metagenome]
MDAFLALDASERATLDAIGDSLFPATGSGPGAAEIGSTVYIDRSLCGAYRDRLETYRSALESFDRAALLLFSKPAQGLDPDEINEMIGRLEEGTLPGQWSVDQQAFFLEVRLHVLEGLFSDPAYGGNRSKQGWRALGHPGVWLENSAEENLSSVRVDKAGVVQSLEDVHIPDPPSPSVLEIEAASFDARLHTPLDDVDVLIVGVGGVGGFIAPMLAGAGLKVVGLEAGPVWKRGAFRPDELGVAYYARATMGRKFALEPPRWRRSQNAETQEASYSLGRMMNGVGGSIIHYGGWLRRFHPHHFRFRSHILERWGEGAIPEGCTVADWPVSYKELEPHFTRIEHSVGVAGDETNPFITRSRPLPLPPMRPFRLGETFSGAAQELGLHPHPSPVGQNTVPFNGLPATTYSAWNNGFGSWDGDKWHPALTSVPEAIATGSFHLRTHARVVRILTDRNGRAEGVEYIDGAGRRHEQRARAVVLAAYTFENIRLMLMSADSKHPDGLGNQSGHLGRHFMTKQFAHVDGFFPGMVFNRHTGPASQAMVVDDFLADSFDAYGEGGFVGGATLGAENQFLPLQIAKESLPPDVPSWGSRFRGHLEQWQHLGVVRVQPDALPYAHHTIDLDPVYRDRSGLGMPVVRLTYDLMPNEIRQAEFFERKCVEILQRMGASKTWAGPRFTGVGSSHDLGGARMTQNPGEGVVNREFEVHDTPGLYVFSGAVMPTCPGINPTLTLWALCSLAAERLVKKLAAT